MSDYIVRKFIQTLDEQKIPLEGREVEYNFEAKTMYGMKSTRNHNLPEGTICLINT